MTGRSGQLGTADPTLCRDLHAESKPPCETVPFFFEQVEGKSLSSTFTEGLLHFILQKKERRAPEHNRDGPGVISVLTGSPAANQHTKRDD